MFFLQMYGSIKFGRLVQIIQYGVTQLLKRKEHVIETALNLFLKSGIQGTSIQMIIDKSGISKGTFYNYFQSKNDLLYGIIKLIHNKVIAKRKEIEDDPAITGMEQFTKQTMLFSKTNKKYNLFPLFEQIFLSDDPSLKKLFQQYFFHEIEWIQNQFVRMFGEEIKPYSLDGALIFNGIIHQFMRVKTISKKEEDQFYENVVRYAAERAEEFFSSMQQTHKAPLFTESLLRDWLDQKATTPMKDQRHFETAHNTLKTAILSANHDTQIEKGLLEGLEFIEHELKQQEPRTFVIESILLSFTAHASEWKETLHHYKKALEPFM
ncbi:transcriptional regulator, TetR family [Shouchella rhizosphaerae]|uniref:TetR/AcrR family transcriptional regulator n=1 Tax=Shouchella clausii TaxID=79880 RepID=A0A268NX81_SHOCL|nr:TetR/AcrR family transcriptional regulator [Shouchella clausii]PAE88133.1 TetR/AcrR family transcriptional regulator [Shouchella clausii]PAE94098.1 TetR/AcrR family transcriptional regulator [Shouchella clausii]SHK95846.1 transcriptional regulator, TetR family [Shouchella rhizosphaerae]